MGRERVEEYDRRASSKYLVRDICVAAFDVNHLCENLNPDKVE